MKCNDAGRGDLSALPLDKQACRYNRRMTETSQLRLPAVLPALRGERLVLRAMADSDAEALFDIYGDPQVMKYTDEPPFPGLETVGLMLRSVRELLAKGESLEWAVALRDGDQVVGTCGLHSFDSALRRAEVGCLLKRSAWGNGYMSEALGLLADFAEDVLRLNCLVADVAVENSQARRLFNKLGYRQAREGMLEIDLHA